MKIIKTKFRCALCGTYRNIGVTETDPKTPETSTEVCASCISRSVVLFTLELEDSLSEEPTS